MSEITILHLSDIHFTPRRRDPIRKKDAEDKLFRQDVQQKLIDTVKDHSGKNVAPDFVVVTGDIAFSGKKYEYDDALIFLNSLKSIFPVETEFLVVPGNHDVDRDKIDAFAESYYVVKKDKVDQFLQQPNQIRKKINVKFIAFRKFSDQLNSSLYESKDDYFWVKNFKDKSLSFLGLNSVWASEGDQDRFSISLGLPQVLSALEQSKKARISNRIILMHHPPINWLKDMEYGKCQTELFKNCQLLLHGHTHSDNALVYVAPASAFICLGANASYTNDKDGFIGFQFLEVDFVGKGRGVKVKVWPYILHEKRNEFVPDRERWPGQEGKPYFIINTLESSPVELQIPEDYKMWVREFHSTLPTDQLAKKGEVVLVSLPQVYIPLETANPFHKPMDEKRIKKDQESPVDLELLEDGEEESEEPKEQANIDIEELIGRVNCVLLEGKVGMGKTTLIKHLAYSLTYGSGPSALKGYLPVLVFLKDFWPIYQMELKNGGTVITFESLLGQYFNKSRCPLTIETVRTFLVKNRVLVMLDGLDEVPEALRSDLVNLIHQFQFQHDKNRVLITGRPHGIEGKGIECFGKNHRRIEALHEKKAEAFISKWFRVVSGQAKGLADLTAGDMIYDIRLHEHARVFTRNPLMLTALCIFYLVGGKRIPDQRANLYDRIVGNLLYRRYHDAKDQEKVNRVREYLMLLAYTMHSRNIKSIDPGEAKEVLKEKYPIMEDESTQVYKKRLETLFNDIEPVCGLLNRLSSGDIEFSHLSFQEFLAAKYMLDMNINYKKYLENPWWEEALLLYTGLMNLEMKKQSNEIIYEMLNMNQVRIQLLGAKALRDFQHSKREEKAVVLARKKLINLIESDINFAELFEEIESSLKKVEELENKARNLIKDQEYLKARFVLQEVLDLEPECEIAIQIEFGFLYNFKNTPENDKEQWMGKKEVINHWKNLWCVISENNKFPLKIREANKSTLSQKEEKPIEKEKTEKTRETTDAVDPSKLPSHEKGEILEIAVLRLFRKFFKIAEDVEKTILVNLRKQKKGPQFGHDISFECISRDNEKVNCKIECKNVKEDITKKDISDKLLAVAASDQKIDHWVLFSARSDPSNYLKELMASLKEKESFPFEIHTWSPESGIKEFFGLEPGIYNKFYGNETINNTHPKDWTEQEQREVYEKWKDKLKVRPFARLPKVWKEYIKNPGRMLLKEERKRNEELETIYHNRVELRCKDKKGMLLNGTMEDHVRQWLEDEKKNVMFILGEFGAGKTAFTYFLSRNLAQEFLNDPVNGWVPVRFSLKYYQSAKDPQTFLQRRLGEFNADLGSWYDLRNEKKKILIILDGFDEMTPQLDPITIRQNISNLTECCNEEFEGMKIIITSRTHFFENKQDENLLLQRLGEPSIFYLASIERPKRIEYLERSIKDPQSKEILRKICKSHDPLDLASKPLFLHMFESVIEKIKEEKLDQKHINEITIYEYYIEETLNRKIKLLDSEKLSNLKDLVSKLIEFLEQIAIKLQESNLDYISLIDFSSDFGRNYDEILWETSGSDNQVNETENEKYDSSEDAAARVQVRSLLSRVDVNNIEEKRPVEFCHRSMREYFVAKGICRALQEDKKRAGELLAKLPLSHEILYFTAQLMKKDNSPNYKKNLLEITKSSVNSVNIERPGGNAITLLFRLLGALPDENWSGLNLDKTNLSGANLSGMKFKGTSLRSANLNNVIFEGADFRDSDLTGVRIEETAPVLAVTTRHLDNRIFAAYKDNTIREWKSITKPGNAESRIVLEDTKGDVIGLEIFNGSSLCAVTNEEMTFYEFDDNEKLIQKARFRIKPGYRRLLTKGNILLLLSEIEKQTNKLHLVDLDKFEEVYSIEQEKISLRENLELQAFAVTDGKSYLRVEGTEQAQNEEILNISLQETTSLCVYTCEKDKQYLLACGQSNGNVSVWQVERLNGKWDHKLLMKNQVHDGMVSTLSFLDDIRIVSGGIDRKISILKFGKGTDDTKGHLENILHMTIKCKGMKIDGLKGSKEQEMFKKLIQIG